MKNKKRISAVALAGFLVLGIFMLNSAAADTREVLRYSSSAQVREALGMEGLNAFMEETGIELDLFVGSSSSAVHRLMNGFSDIASTAERLHEGHQRYGYYEIPFCRAPLVVITNLKTPVDAVSSIQLRSIFAGTLTNWKELGGPDETIIVVVPEKSTSAYKNFTQLALKSADIKFDFMAYRSTDVARLVDHIPWSISFISQGAHLAGKEIKPLRIDAFGPQDSEYPFHQTFSFVVMGTPTATAQKLIDFVFSAKGRAVIENNGLAPLSR